MLPTAPPSGSDFTLPWPVHPAAELFRLLNGQELRSLADSILSRGLAEPVWLWDDPERGRVLLDGRNRSRACLLAGVPIATREFKGDEVAAAEFAIEQNVERRHLSTGEKAAVAHDSVPILAKANEARANRQRAESALRNQIEQSQSVNESCADRHTTPAQGVTADHGRRPKAKRAKANRTTDLAAAKVGTSGRAVARFKRLQENAPDLADKVRANEMALDRAERILRDREAEARRVAEAQAAAAAAPVAARVDIRHGDFREVLADLRDVDAIITDPPYPHEYLPLLDDLAAWSDKALAPEGVLVILFGQTYLPEVYRRLDGGRPYRWTGCYLTPGGGYVSQARRVQSNWKPLLVYGGGPRFADTLRTEGSDANAKSLHKWGQDYAAFHTLIERFTKPGQTVVDPFAGSGTTLLAAKALGRHAIGAELDVDHFRTASERVA